MQDNSETLQDLILNAKILPPRPPQAASEISRIQRLNIKKWKEADVRAEIIDPLVRLLGYDKESYFSLEREKSVEVLGNHKALDYNFTLWSENFWLIEAKRPNSGDFKSDALFQALRYAAHPDINAALIVLCDGDKIEVYDREVSLTTSVLRIDRPNLDQDFDKLRAILSPWQVFFFEKRRVLRLIDKVFDKEMHLGRIKEFRDAIDRRLAEKRSIILTNFQDLVDIEKDFLTYADRISNSSVEDIADVLYFLSQTESAIRAMTDRLIEHCSRNAFQTIYRIFPDKARDANHNYWGHALDLLMSLAQTDIHANWLPGYLCQSGRQNFSAATEILISFCLSGFRNDEIRKIVLLYSAAARRIAKLHMVLKQDIRGAGDIFHVIQRFAGDELSFAQAVSTPKRHLLLLLDNIEVMATAKFVRTHTNDQSKFLHASAHHDLEEMWRTEINLLSKVSNYRQLLADHDFGETFCTEGNAVVYDQLGHLSLCIIEKYPTWKSWAIEHKRDDIEQLAAYGSWQARKWLGLDINADISRPTDREIADRFFFGDVNTSNTLRSYYGWR
ncbi:hypothetical protein [Azospirillum sp.]|uniref:hypothetical protein n=1 Tax=Azospirillum sp. TaxID=34012 RepID=UPI003D75CCCD